MWVAELKVWHEGSPSLELTRKYDVEVFNYYLNTFTRGRDTYLSRVLYVFGPDAQKFIADFSREKRVKVQRVAGNQIFTTARAHTQYHSLLCGRRVFFLKPNCLRGGFEYWTVAAWEKESLEDLVKRIRRGRPHATVEVLSVSRRDVNFLASDAFNGLTALQMRALATAFENGYYDYPRRHSLKEIARIAGLPRTTFQEHLQKAEAKAMRSLVSQSLPLSGKSRPWTAEG